MNLLLLYRIKCLPKNTNRRLAIPALAGLLVKYDCKCYDGLKQFLSVENIHYELLTLE